MYAKCKCNVDSKNYITRTYLLFECLMLMADIIKFLLESPNKFQIQRKSARYSDARNAILRPIPYAIVRLKRMKSVIIIKPYERLNELCLKKKLIAFYR